MDKIKWDSRVSEIRGYLDESYVSSLPGKIGGLYSSGDCKVPWASIGVNKFLSRVIPVYSASDFDNSKVYLAIDEAIENAVTFGNSTIIISDDGTVRVSSPENGFCERDAYGNTFFTEEIGNITLFGIDGIIECYYKDTDSIVSTNLRYFTIFNGADSSSAVGTSRISNAIMKDINSATRNKMRMEVASDRITNPQIVFNGIFEGLDAKELKTGMKSLLAGNNEIIGIPVGPNGEKIAVDSLETGDFSPYLKKHEMLARSVASSFNIDASELGISTTLPSSAEAIFAGNTDLILEVNRFERSINSIIQEVLDFWASVTGQTKIVLSWADPSVPSKASQADAFIKLASGIPNIWKSAKALQWAGIPSDLAQELAEMAQEVNNNE